MLRLQSDALTWLTETRDGTWDRLWGWFGAHLMLDTALRALPLPGDLANLDGDEEVFGLAGGSLLLQAFNRDERVMRWTLHTWTGEAWRSEALPYSRMDVALVDEDHLVLESWEMEESSQRLARRGPSGWPAVEESEPLTAPGEADFSTYRRPLQRSRPSPTTELLAGLDGEDRLLLLLHEDGRWRRVDEGLRATETTSLALDEDRLAWSDTTGVHLARWDGARWRRQELSSLPGDDVALGELDGQLCVAWSRPFAREAQILVWCEGLGFIHPRGR